MAKKKSPKPVEVELTLGEQIILFIQTYCRVPEGEFVGQKVILEDFQKKFILDVYDGELVTGVHVYLAILSMAKKNAKTTLIAMILLAHIVGPAAEQNSQIVSGAMSQEQASLVFELAEKMINLEPELAKVIKILSSRKRLYGLPLNVEYRALSAEGKTSQGKSPVLIILDEIGQIVGPKDAFVDSLMTAQGAHKRPRILAISTQAENDGDYFSIMIDDALEGKDLGVVIHLYTAPADCKLMDEASWYASNPALGKFRSYDDLQRQAARAERMPSREAVFRNFNLNQRVTTSSPFVSRDTWKSCGGVVDPIEDCTEIFGGLDLSSHTDLTALVLIGLCRGKWNTYCFFWTPEKGLQERAHNDRVPYPEWVKQGLIFTVPGATVDLEFVAKQLAEITEKLTIIALAYDRWRVPILKKECDKIGLILPFIEWGQGFKDMSPAVDALESKILNGVLKHGGHPVLTMCANNAKIVKDPAGNKKFDKIKSTKRIDGIVALAEACGVAERVHNPETPLDDFINKPLIA